MAPIKKTTSQNCIHLGTLVHPCSWTCQPRLTTPFTEDLHNLVGDSSANRDMKMKRCANTSIFITRHEKFLELSKQHVQDFININYSLDKLCVTHWSRWRMSWHSWLITCLNRSRGTCDFIGQTCAFTCRISEAYGKFPPTHYVKKDLYAGAIYYSELRFNIVNNIIISKASI
jgi:hypothetical protein